jgi:hypothetical protein
VPNSARRPPPLCRSAPTSFFCASCTRGQNTVKGAKASMIIPSAAGRPRLQGPSPVRAPILWRESKIPRESDRLEPELRRPIISINMDVQIINAPQLLWENHPGLAEHGMPKLFFDFFSVPTGLSSVLELYRICKIFLLNNLRRIALKNPPICIRMGRSFTLRLEVNSCPRRPVATGGPAAADAVLEKRRKSGNLRKPEVNLP